MAKFIVTRLGQLIPLLLILSIFVFLLLRVLPGDPLRTIVGPEIELHSLTAEERSALESDLGLDKPLAVQYFDWLGNLLVGDWGQSYLSRQPVSAIVGDRALVTLQLGTFSWLLALAIGIPIGVFSALRRNTWPDVFVNVFALAGLATPNFLLGLLLIIVFSVYLGVLPTSGFVLITDDPIDSFRHMVLPAIALSTGLMTALIRQTRSSVLEVMNEDYIRTARAKGLAPNRVVIKHALKNALLPVVTVAGLQIGNLLSGTVIIETMFSVPGIGRATIDGVYAGDFALVQVVVLVLAVATVLGNLLADVLYVQLDPRIRY